ncbi:MAG: hypothetical protein Q9207_007569 [Kuettlingeria erythrocarpa]
MTQLDLTSGQSDLLQAAQSLVLSFIRSAEDGRDAKQNRNIPLSGRLKGQDDSLFDQFLPEGINGSTNVYEGRHDVHTNGVANDDSQAACMQRSALVEHHGPQKLTQIMDLELPKTGAAQDGFLEEVRKVLRYSVNTWDPDFMSKLYASTDAPGLAAEMVLASLNTQVHTFQVSPALTIVEKHTTRALANLFGFIGPHAGSVAVQRGSASNVTSVVIARNTLYPNSKEHGNSANGLKLLLFTSAHGHYSIEKAALMLGFGSSSVWSVPVDPKTG